MLEARIVSARGSLYFAAEGTPYDLEVLRRHVRDLTPSARIGDVRVEVTFDSSVDAVTPAMSGWLWQLADAGVRARCVPAGAARLRLGAADPDPGAPPARAGETTRAEVSTMGGVLEEFATRFVAILDFALGAPAPVDGRHSSSTLA